MSFRLVCPTSSDHVRFEVTAHVQELWEVGPDAQFRELITGVDVDHSPDSQDLYICRECGAQAQIRDFAP